MNEEPLGPASDNGTGELLDKISRLEESEKWLKVRAEELSREQDLLHTLIDNIPDVIYFKDARSRFTKVNRAWARWQGLQDVKDAIGKSDFDFINKEFAQEAFEDEQRIMRTGKSLVSKIEKIESQDSAPQWLSATKVPVFDKNGDIIGTCGISRDITGIKVAEDTLEKERNLLRTLIDNMPDYIFIKDVESRFVINNRGHLDALGAAQQADVAGKTDFDFFPHELAARYFSDEQLVLQTGRQIVGREEPCRNAAGKDHWLLTTKVPLRDTRGTIVGLVGISRDVTSRKQSEVALEKERNLLMTLINNMPDIIFIKDKESRFLVNNKAHLRALRASTQAEVMGKNDFDIFPRELAARYFSDEQVVLQTGKQIINREEPCRDPEGREQWLSTTKVPLRDSEGNITGLVGISRDITERKRFEQALQKAKDELEIRVEERTADLKKANERLATRLAQLHFLNTTSYELAQFIRIAELGPAIVEAFTARFPQAEAILCIRGGEGFKFLCATKGITGESVKVAAERALAVFFETELQRPFMVKQWAADDHVGAFEWQDVDHLPCYLAIPLLADNRALAIIQVFTTEAFIELYDNEQPVLTTLAAHAASCLGNAVHYKELGERARLQGELDAARSIQQRFTPHERPSIPHVNVKAVYYPAYEVGGDYVDYFQTDDDAWVVVIADVCGKGIPAALFMTMLRSAFRVEGRTATSAKQLLCAVNESMRVNLDDKSFVTVLCLLIARDGSSMTYARAGHPMLLRLSAPAGQPENVRSSGLALGLVSDAALFSSMIDEVAVTLRPGDRYIAYTDGLTEATNPDKDAYGAKRLFDLLARDGGSGPDAIIELIMADIKEFTQGSPYHDDLTILAMEVTQDGRR